MKVYYIDTSAFLAVLFEEGPSRELIKLMESDTEILSSSLIEAEVLATLKRENVPLSDAVSVLERVSLVFPDRSLQKELTQLLEKQYCRGADSFHIATALYLDPHAADLIFVSLDEKQNQGARLMGFRCWKPRG